MPYSPSRIYYFEDFCRHAGPIWVHLVRSKLAPVRKPDTPYTQKVMGSEQAQIVRIKIRFGILSRNIRVTTCKDLSHVTANTFHYFSLRIAGISLVCYCSRDLTFRTWFQLLFNSGLRATKCTAFTILKGRPVLYHLKCAGDPRNVHWWPRRFSMSDVDIVVECTATSLESHAASCWWNVFRHEESNSNENRIFMALFYWNLSKGEICPKSLTNTASTIPKIKEMESGNDWCHFQPMIPFTQSVSLLSYCYILRLLRCNIQLRKSSSMVGDTPIKRNLSFKHCTKFCGPTWPSNHTTTIGKGLSLTWK